jgi:hypothetical protein
LLTEMASWNHALRALLAGVLVAIAWPGGAQADVSASGVPRVAHVVLIMFENHERGEILGSSSAPTFNRLASEYAQATDELAVAHPSLPNYLALFSGSTQGVTDDCTDCMQQGPTIASQLAGGHRTAIAYAEGYPSSARFAKRHVPFLYFPAAISRVKSLEAFDVKRLPAFAMVVPDLCHDMHDCPVADGDRWLRDFITPLLAVRDTVVFVAFDEGTTDIGGGWTVPLLMLGTGVRRHAVFRRQTTHYGVLRTIEAMLGLPPLGRARGARLITGVWR